MLSGELHKRLNISDISIAIILLLAGGISVVLLKLFIGRSLGAGLIGLLLASAIMYGVNTILLGVLPLRYAKYQKVSFVSGFLDFTSYIAAGAFTFFSGYILDKGLGWNRVFTNWIILVGLGVVSLIIYNATEKSRLV